MIRLEFPDEDERYPNTNPPSVVWDWTCTTPEDADTMGTLNDGAEDHGLVAAVAVIVCTELSVTVPKLKRRQIHGKQGHFEYLPTEVHVLDVRAENLLRKSWKYVAKRTKCPQGHSMQFALVTPEGGRLCRSCTREALKQEQGARA